MADTRQGQNQGDRSTQTNQPSQTERQGGTTQDQPDRQATPNPRRSGSDQDTTKESGSDRQNQDVETGRTGSNKSEESI